MLILYGRSGLMASVRDRTFCRCLLSSASMRHVTRGMHALPPLAALVLTVHLDIYKKNLPFFLLLLLSILPPFSLENEVTKGAGDHMG